MTRKEFENQKGRTIQYLHQLALEINSNPNISLKQKKKLIKEFQKHHPEALNWYFLGQETTIWEYVPIW